VQSLLQTLAADLAVAPLSSIQRHNSSALNFLLANIGFGHSVSSAANATLFAWADVEAAAAKQEVSRHGL
jgi:hypothetical protein